MNLIPPIGASGLFKLTHPFNTAINLNISYTCMAVRKLSEVSALGSNAFKLYYEPFGLTQTDHDNDLAAGVCIVSLQSNNGIWAYVPSSYIESYPQVNGVSYTGVALMVDLGALPDALNLDYVKNAIKDQVTAIVGVNAIVTAVTTTPKTLISQDNHMAAENARQQNITNNVTDYSKNQSLNDMVVQMRTRITQLEEYIASKQL